jgi:hypothetical protein
VKLIIHLQLVPRSRKRGSIQSLPYTPSWRIAYLDNFIFTIFSCLPDCELDRQYASGRSCDQSSRHGFPWVSSVFKQMLRWFPTACFLRSPPYLHSSKLNPFDVNTTKLLFQILQFYINFENQKFLSPYLTILSFTLSSSKVLAGYTWEPSNKMVLFLRSQ